MKTFKVGDILALEFRDNYKIYKVQKATLYAVTLESGLIVGQDLKLHANIPIGILRVTPVTQEIKDSIAKYRKLRFVAKHFKPEYESCLKNLDEKELNGICRLIRKMKAKK